MLPAAEEILKTEGHSSNSPVKRLCTMFLRPPPQKSALLGPRKSLHQLKIGLGCVATSLIADRDDVLAEG